MKPRSDELILVDRRNRIRGYRSKEACHDGEGILHRAFSIFLIDEQGRVLLQQRSVTKRLWPLFWSNTCCSHPRRGETMETATHRRLKEELRVDAPLRYLFRFPYHARFGTEGSERELCSVYLGTLSGTPKPVRSEIADWKWIAPTALDRDLRKHADRYTPWFLLEWPRVRMRLR